MRETRATGLLVQNLTDQNLSNRPARARGSPRSRLELVS